MQCCRAWKQAHDFPAFAILKLKDSSLLSGDLHVEEQPMYAGD
jgi:hypothetical protein